jgi:molybdopterin converting factor small subunit
MKEGSPEIAEILERIRARLRTQFEADPLTGDKLNQPTESPSATIEGLYQQLEAIRNAHRRVGIVNPRNPGLVNTLAQVFKRALWRILAWHTRPIIEFQARTIQFLSDITKALGEEQSRLASFEKTIDALRADMAQSHQQRRTESESAIRNQDNARRDEEQIQMDH